MWEQTQRARRAGGPDDIAKGALMQQGIELVADERDVAAVRAATGVIPRVALVLGSGLGGLADRIEGAKTVDYCDLPGFPKPPMAVAGHGGRLVAGTLGGTAVVAFSGRVHVYQGVSAFEATWPVRLAHDLGASTLIVTNAAGGLDPALSTGDITLIADHLNLTGMNPLVGWPGPRGGTPFVPMGGAYDPELRSLARDVAEEQGVALREAVYAGLLGPAYETPAEVEYLRRIGAQTVGMSTVSEVIVARALGMRVLGLSLVSNAAGGAHLSHDEVLAAGDEAAESLEGLVVGILARL